VALLQQQQQQQLQQPDNQFHPPNKLLFELGSKTKQKTVQKLL
jgi:hypothetical protein